MNQLANHYRNPTENQYDSYDLVSTRAAGRATYDDYYLNPITSGFAYISPQDDSDWKLTVVDERHLANRRPEELINILINTSTEFDRALHDMQQFCNNGWKLRTDDPVGDQILEQALNQMADMGQDFDAKINSLISSAFLWGALYTESIFDPVNGSFVDIAIISPAQARFQRRRDEVRGQYWQLGQEEQGRFVALDDPTIIYKSINPVPDRPFGRPMVNSSIFPTIFQLGLLKALRQVIESQAWPRQFWKIDRVQLRDAGVNPKDIDKIVKDTEQKIEKYMQNANLDKAMQPIIDSAVDNQMIGGINRSNFGAVEAIQRILDIQITRGLRQYPILFGINSNSGLSDNSDVQLEAYSIFIDGFQSTIEKHLTRQLQLVLNSQGRPDLRPIFELDRVNSIVRELRARSLEKETNAITKMIQNRMITRFEGRSLLKSFSKQADPLDLDIPGTASIRDIVDLKNAGIISADESRELLIDSEGFEELSGPAPQAALPAPEEGEDEDGN